MSTLQEKISLLSVENKAKMDSQVKAALNKEKAENKDLATMDVAKRTVHLAKIRQTVMEKFIADSEAKDAKSFFDSHVIVCRPDTAKVETAKVDAKVETAKVDAKVETAKVEKAPKAPYVHV